jgi:predicted dehydrogenase
LKKEWVIKALNNKKHVLCEKPVSACVADYEEILNVAKKVNRYVMDGTMFVHNNRTQHFLDYISNHAVFGNVIRINSEFTFRGDEHFFANDIRTTKDGDPYGCIGDLGWYCVRLAQLVFGKVKRGKAVRAQVTYWKMNEQHVPMDAQCLVVFDKEEDGDDDNDEEELVLSFHCSFLHPLSQRVSIVGTKQTLEMVDYVVPREGINHWIVHGEDLTRHDTYSVRTSDVMEVPSGPVQEVLMWRNFSRYCREVESRGWCNGEAEQLSVMSIENQRIVDALMKSISEDGKPIGIY